MNQVGDTRVFSIDPEPSEADVYSYVWSWWDGTSDATALPMVVKTINIGGAPGTDELLYTCTPVLSDGQSTTLNGVITANGPPVLVAPVTISANDQIFPYDTVITVKAFDFNDDALTFSWYENGVFLSNGDTSSTAPLEGTWTGNGVTVVDTYAGFENVYSLSVGGPRTLELRVVDFREGTTTLEVELRGVTQLGPVLGGAGAASTGLLDSSVVRVGPGVEVEFEVYGRNPSPGGGPVSFSWNFAGSNGWDTLAGPETGVVTAVPDGGYKSLYSKSIAAETFPTSLQKTVVAVATVSAGGMSQELRLPVTIQANRAPTNLTFLAKVDGVDYSLASGAEITEGGVVELGAEATDPDMDLVTYEWTFLQPAGLSPSTLKLWGPKVMVNTQGWSGVTLQATVRATDRLGLVYTELTPAIPVA